MLTEKTVLACLSRSALADHVADYAAWAAQRFETAGRRVEARLAPGTATEVIAHAARAQGIDLLVMGAYSHSPLGALLRGSKTNVFLQSFPIPTLLVR